MSLGLWTGILWKGDGYGQICLVGLEMQDLIRKDLIQILCTQHILQKSRTVRISIIVLACIIKCFAAVRHRGEGFIHNGVPYRRIHICKIHVSQGQSCFVSCLISLYLSNEKIL